MSSRSSNLSAVNTSVRIPSSASHSCLKHGGGELHIRRLDPGTNFVRKGCGSGVPPIATPERG